VLKNYKAIVISGKVLWSLFRSKRWVFFSKKI